MTDISFSFTDNSCVFSWTEAGPYKNTITVPLDGTAGFDRVKVGELVMDVRAYAWWVDERTLEMRIRPLAAVSDRIFKFEFVGDRLKMYPDMFPGIDEKAKAIGETVKCILKGAYFSWWVDVLVPKVSRILQPVHHGKKIK